jgi:phenylalanyl-tRNA synthetase beta chain
VPRFLHPGAAAVIAVGGESVGAVGELHPEVAARFEIGAACALFEIDLTPLLARAPEPRRYREVSRFPQIRRDLAVVVGRAQPAGELLAAIRAEAGADCISAEVFDRYEGPGVAAGRVSLAFRLVFQRIDRTLEEKDVAPVLARVVDMLARRFGGELR